MRDSQQERRQNEQHLTVNWKKSEITVKSAQRDLKEEAAGKRAGETSEI